jgi:hypothetical protein
VVGKCAAGGFGVEGSGVGAGWGVGGAREGCGRLACIPSARTLWLPHVSVMYVRCLGGKWAHSVFHCGARIPSEERLGMVSTDEKQARVGSDCDEKFELNIVR